MTSVQTCPTRPPCLRLAAIDRRPAPRVTAVVLLAGAVRPSPLLGAAGRSPLDLPVRLGESLLDHWVGRAAALDGVAGDLPVVRVAVDRASPPPRRHRRPAAGVVLTVEHDPRDFRGTAGVLRDLAADYDDGDLLVVANAAQALVGSLAEAVDALLARGGDLVMAAGRDGAPAGLMLVRCGCLRRVPDVGFVDLKEQALAAIARDHAVRVCRLDGRLGLPIRTLEDYTRALRHAAGGPEATGGPFAEDWRPTFAVVEPGARVDADAHVYDSVVLDGGRVERGAVVVRSVVCDGGVVPAGRVVADRVVGPGGRVPVGGRGGTA